MRFVENIISGIIDHSKTLLYMFFVCIENTRVKKVIVGASLVNWKLGPGGGSCGHRCDAVSIVVLCRGWRQQGWGTGMVGWSAGDGLGAPPGSLWAQLVGSAAVKKGRLALAHWVEQQGDKQRRFDNFDCCLLSV